MAQAPVFGQSTQTPEAEARAIMEDFLSEPDEPAGSDWADESAES